ncbi:MAG: CoA-binding protein [Desulfovibrio sp.]|nr:MAG: CoA-binding protein [Desulfovibrio sp.]
MLSDAELKELLVHATTIAVVGAKDTPGQAVDTVGRYLMDAGYTVIPVHPKRQEVWGLKTFPSITAVDQPIHIVDLFRASQYCDEHATETTILRPLPLCFWMQLGVRNETAKQLLAKGPVKVVEDRCIMREHGRLFP